MFKKAILLAAGLATASFAAWDYYPVPEAGKGEAKATFAYDFDGDWSRWGLAIGARYTVVPNLEIAILGWGYSSWDIDCKNCAEGSGFTDLDVGVRYQIVPIVNAFVDVNFPIGGDEVTSDEWGFHFGAQYSQEFVPNLKFGAEAGLYWGLEHNSWNPGLILNIAAEVGYSITNIGLTPFLGLEFKDRVTESELNDYGVGDDGDTNINVWLGAAYAINPQMAVEAKLIVRSGDIDGDATGISATFYFNF